MSATRARCWAITTWGQISAAAGQLDTAETYYKKALTLNHSSEMVMLDLALVYEMQEQLDRARDMYQQALDFNPDSEQARKRLGRLFLEEKDLDGALEQFRELEKIQERIQTDPQETRLRISLIYSEKGEYDRAVTELNLVLTAQPDNARARYFLGVILTEAEEDDKAIGELLKIPTDTDYYADARLYLSHIYRRQKKLAQAIVEATHVLGVKQDNLEVLEYLAGLERENDNRPRAIQILERMISPGSLQRRLSFYAGSHLRRTQR